MICRNAALLLTGFWIIPDPVTCHGAAASTAQIEFFEKRIRPILVERCYECHSDGAKKLKGGLRLDSREGWSKGGDSGPAIVPGDPEKSLLVHAVRWLDEDTQMPPKNKLPQVEIDAIVEWVKLGAPDPRLSMANTDASSVESPLRKTNHWAYQPVKKYAPPSVKNTSWPRGDIDRFILATLEQRGLPPAADADPATLCRRIYFDLTGLPPTPEELEAFAQSAMGNPQSAITSLVDRLLASPRFGEHWGRHWLDVARFGESVTLRGFIFKEAWRYRDYVIDSFDRDVPFDQFIKEHISGDLLPHRSVGERRRQMIATTFLTLGNWNLEEQDKKQLDMDVVDEQLDTIGKAFLGQTIGCARCHDHKFDPIPATDYYAMAGILKNSRTLKHANVSEWLEAPLPVEPEQEKKLSEHEAAVAALQAEIKSAKEAAKTLAGKSGEPKEGVRKASVVAAKDLPGIVVDSTQARQVGSWKHSQYSKHYIGDGYWHDENTAKGEKTLSFAPEITRPGRYEVRLAYVHAPNRASNIPVTIFHADGETTVHVNQQEPPVIEGRFVSLGQFRFEANGFGYALVSNDGTQGYVTADAVQFLAVEDVAAEITGPASTRNPKPETRNADQSLLTSVPTNIGPDIRALETKLKKLQETGPKRPMVMAVKEVDKAEDIPVHVRGSVHNLGAVVPRGFLTVASRGPAPSMPEKESGRRELAGWIASSDNPLTARVMVNRVWLWLFGEGLVRTPDNFGTTGEVPSHPELLDYLATRFVAEGWSVKKLVREVVISRTYQLSSVGDDVRRLTSTWSAEREMPNGDQSLLTSAPTIDPENRLLGRANRRRLTAEQMRDAMLVVSGQLKLDAGGQTYPSNRASDYGFVFNEPRRSVYAPVFRNALPEIFEVFDFAPSSMVTGRRHTSTAPTQALFLLNHPFVREQAQAAARRLLAEPARDDATRLDRAYRLTLGRPPSSDESDLARRHLAKVGESSTEAAWTELFHALFASAEFRYLD